ncbi:MAG: acetate--CoA ligase family protein [Desulfobacteraceae bacterium]|nr:acetate--CoA ligase family protein [Desulfobacteraceae bacterium]
MVKKIENWFNKLEIKGRPNEFEAKRLVQFYDISVPDARVFVPKDRFEVSKITPPYVLKVCSPDILHKTEQKGVVLNVTKEDIQKQLNDIRKRFAGENILIEHQSDFEAPEFIIGVIKDPALGHAVMVGAGGIFTEIYKDVTFRLAPCSKNEAKSMINELALAEVFHGFRGMNFDEDKFAEIISNVSILADDMGDKLSQLDIKPIVFSQGRWVALDVKIIIDN